MGVEDGPIGLRDFKRKISVPYQEIIELVSKVFRIPVLLAVHQQVPDDVFLLRQRFLLSISEVEFGHQVDGQTDQPEPGKALKCQPPRQPLAQ